MHERLRRRVAEDSREVVRGQTALGLDGHAKEFVFFTVFPLLGLL